MESWIIYSTLAVLSTSILMALQKVPSAKNIDKYEFNLLTYFFATLIAIPFLYNFVNFDKVTILYAVVWGTGFTVLNLIQMHALEKNDTSGVFPFTSLLSNIFVVVGGVLFLNENISLLQFIAVLLAFTVVAISSYKTKVSLIANVLPLFFAIALLSTFNKFVQKFGAVHTELYNFIFWQLFFSFLSSLLLISYKKKFFLIKTANSKLFVWSLFSAIPAFTTTLLIIKALSTGPISLVYIIIGTYTFFTSLIASIFFGEKLTIKKVSFIILSILIIILIKIG